MYIPNHTNLLYKLILWLPSSNNNIRQFDTGFLQPFTHRDIASHQYAFHTPSNLKSYTIVGSVDHGQTVIPASLPFYLLSSPQFSDTNNKKRNVMVAFYAIMTALFLYNSFLFVSLKLPVYGFYLLFLGNAIFLCGFIDGSTLRWLWPNSPQLNFRLTVINGAFVCLFYQIFVWAALDRLQFSPRLCKIYRIILWAGALIVLHNGLTPFINHAVTINQMFASFLLPLNIAIIIAAIRQRLPTAYYLLIAEVCVTVGGTCFMLMINGKLPITGLSFWSMHAGFFGEALLLSFALAERTRIIQQQAVNNLQKYELLYEDSVEGLFEFNLLDNSLKCNNAFARLFGFTNSEALATISDIEKQTAKFWSDQNLVVPLFKQGHLTDHEIPIVSSATQKELWVSVTMRLVNNNQGEPRFIEGAMIDITERKLREKSQQNYKKLYDHLPLGLFTYSLKDGSFNCNKAWATMFGFANMEAMVAADLADNEFSTFIAAISTGVLFDLLSQQGKIHGLEIPIQSSNDPTAPRWAALSMDLIRDDLGNPESVKGSCIDISERKLKEKAEAEKLVVISNNQAKSKFFATMSHELRTPLTAILGYSEAILNPGIELDFAKTALARIHNSGKNLLQIISDILDLSKVEAQKLEVEQLQVQLLPLLTEVKDSIQILVEKKGLSFAIDYLFPLPKLITSDPTRIKQVLLNLCSNAITFTEQGSVTIEVSCSKENQTLRFAVKDTGVGLRPEQINDLFDLFAREDSTTTRNRAGSGLGLHLAKQLAQQLGGDITVSSVYGEGSTFIFTVATAALQNTEWLNQLPGAAPLSQIVVPTLKGNVLYAEDNEDNQRLVRAIVEKTGADITVVSNGQKALDLCAITTFDLVLTDVRMPIIDGVELTKLLLEKNAALPVVALTATLIDKEIKEFNTAGFKRILRKPIDRQAIYDVMCEYLPVGDKTVPSLSFKENPIRVLLAEDNLDNQGLIALYIKKAKASVEVVENGVEAVEKALAHEFDLILMDMQMPVMDGMTAVRALRTKGYRKPIYALTADDSDDAIQACKNAGCEGLLTKPLEVNKLTALINEIAKPYVN